MLPLKLLACALLLFVTVSSLAAADNEDSSLNDITVSDVLVDSVKHSTDTLTTQLIELGVDVNHPDNRGQTALAQAVESGNLQISKLLLDHGADWHVQSDTANALPLCVALLAGQVAIAELLIERGASVNQISPTGKGYSVPEYLCAFDKVHHSKINAALYQLLLKAGFKLTDNMFPSGRGNATLLHDFARTGNLYGLQKWTEAGYSFKGLDSHGESALHRAMGLDDMMAFKVAGFLVQHGVDVNGITHNGKTAFDYAKQRGKTKTAAYLAQYCAKE